MVYIACYYIYDIVSVHTGGLIGMSFSFISGFGDWEGMTQPVHTVCAVVGSCFSASDRAQSQSPEHNKFLFLL